MISLIWFTCSFNLEVTAYWTIHAASGPIVGPTLVSET